MSDSEDDKSEALAPVWAALKEGWDKLNTYAQAKLKAATSEDIDSDIAAMAIGGTALFQRRKRR